MKNMKLLFAGRVPLAVSGVLAVLYSLNATTTPLVLAQSASSNSAIREFYPIGDYVLDIDGKAAPDAKFYFSERGPAIVLQTPEIDSLVLLRPGGNLVQTVPRSNLTQVSESRWDLSLDSIADQGKLQILASWIVFPVDGKELTLREKPWLLSLVDIADLKKHSPEYVWRMKAYQPKMEVIEELKSLSTDAKVRVFFGSWCPHCKRHVPLMMKVASQLSASKIHIEFYGLPRGWAQHPVAGPLQIRNVPTGVVWVDGKEVGRINGEQWGAPENALKEILVH